MGPLAQSPASSRRLGTVLTTAMVAASLAACGAGNDGAGVDAGSNEASDIGVTEDSVAIGSHYPLTGVAAQGYSTIPLGAQAYFDHVNDNGGVNGREIAWIYEDDAYDPTTTRQVVSELVLEEKVFALMGGLGTPTHRAVLDFLTSEEVPDLFVASGSLLWGDDPETHPETFGWQTDYESEGKVIGQYIDDNFPDAKVGLFVQDDDFGEDGEQGVRQYIGDQIVGTQRYAPDSADADAQIAALQAAGADVVVGFTVPSHTALSQLAALALDYRPQWFYSNVGSDPTLVGSLLNTFSRGTVTDASSLEGAITTSYLPTVDQPDDPWIQLFQRIWDEHGEESEKLTNYHVYGMSQAYTMVQALQSAGRNPTRNGLVEAVERAGGDWEGPGRAPFRYSEDSHLGISGMSIVQITGTTTTELAPVQVTDIGDAEIEDYDGAPTSPPENGIPDEDPVA